MHEANRGKITVVGDDHAVRDSLRFMLEVVGHTVETFASAAEFLGAEVRHLACLILDHHMPQLNGMESAERLRADGVTIPILLITDAPAAAARAAELSVNVLEKPHIVDGLLDFCHYHTRP
jgi:two-component system response regulator FixJ